MPIDWEELTPDPDDLVTVEEAAEILGLSVATVRRKAADGEIDALKVGRSWVVDRSSLSRRSVETKGRRVPTSKQVDADLAIQHVSASDLRNDTWAPDPLDHQDQVSARIHLAEAAERRLDGDEQFESAMVVAVPKSVIFQRNAVDLSVVDRVAYHAAVLTAAPAIEDVMSEAVYSARLNTDPREKRLLEPGADAWLRWNQAVIESIPDDGWVAATDVTAYFDCIVHSILIRDLQRVGLSSEVEGALRQMLSLWTRTPGIGVPQGPDASRVLANLYFAPIDEVMGSIEGVRYFRYMDDIRVVSDSRHEAIGALQVLDDECRLRNLHLSTKKTRLIAASDAEAEFTDEELDRLSYAFEFSFKKTQVRSDLADLVSKTLQTVDPVDLRRLRFGILRLRKLREERGLQKALANLEHLAPLGRQAVAYLLPWYGRASVQKKLVGFLRDPERNTSDYFSSWLLAGFVDLDGAPPDDVIDYARSVCQSAQAPEWYQAIAMSVMARGGRASDLRLLKDRAENNFSPILVRGACVALARVGELDRQVARRAVRFPAVEPTIEYLTGRALLPSIVLPGRR